MNLVLRMWKILSDMPVEVLKMTSYYEKLDSLGMFFYA